ncbi:MAG: NAD(P)H-dependent oxidoreductase [Chloroflexi bacterium]|nr:NAD(P)H-dependent oxidoreductase [Chloroflexota bacterium]
MKILALNSSPRGAGQSKTELLLTHFVKGLQKAGAEVEVVNLRQKKINYCTGCYTCWTKTPGVCMHKDEMALELFPKWLAADIVFYASPLYHYLINAQMKTFIERTLPVLMPYLQRKDGITRHPLRSKRPDSILISVAGFPDNSVFDQLSFWAKKVMGSGLLAEIYRPAAEAMISSGKRFDILEAMEQAGVEIVENRSVSKRTMDRIMQPITSPEMMATMSNLAWQAMIDRHTTMAEASRKGAGIRPNSIETLMAMLVFAFNPLKAGEKAGTLQFNFSGEKPGACYFTIGKGDIQAAEGKALKADCVIDTPFEVWADIIEGKADGAKSMMDGKYKVQGDMSLMIVFSRD